MSFCYACIWKWTISSSLIKIWKSFRISFKISFLKYLKKMPSLAYYISIIIWIWNMIHWSNNLYFRWYLTTYWYKGEALTYQFPNFHQMQIKKVKFGAKTCQCSCLYQKISISKIYIISKTSLNFGMLQKGLAWPLHTLTSLTCRLHLTRKKK